MKYIPNPYNINLINFENNIYIINYIFNSQDAPKIINFIYFSNYTLLENNTEYLQALRESDLVLLDGIGLKIYFNSLNNDKIYNNNGTDLLPLIIKYCIKNNYDIAFYGTTESSLQKCYSKYKKYKNIYYAQNGYSELKWDKIRDNSILLVGKGTPNQELWQLKHKNRLKEKNITVIGVGGFFNFCSGSYSRAPKPIIVLKIEWLYRLIKNPKLHYKKNIRNIFIFKYLFFIYFKKITNFVSLLLK
jgi:N-acetylglucosaminyldiphosphoundecaprenol N-acetyl-beta-D-mannosaminyltransferase